MRGFSGRQRRKGIPDTAGDSSFRDWREISCAGSGVRGGGPDSQRLNTRLRALVLGAMESEISYLDLMTYMERF